jgi:hypothetical protein
MAILIIKLAPHPPKGDIYSEAAVDWHNIPSYTVVGKNRRKRSTCDGLIYDTLNIWTTKYLDYYIPCVTGLLMDTSGVFVWICMMRAFFKKL